MTRQQGWTTNGIRFYHNNRPDNLVDLPPGIYEYEEPTISTPWCFNRLKDSFDIPEDAIELHGERQRLLLKNAKSNRSFGAILSGTRGTGKTFLMKIIANQLIDQGFAVVLVKEPIKMNNSYAMDTVVNSVAGNLCCIFDEFEKTHANEDAQKHLLTILDGVQSSSEFRRVYLLSSNSGELEANLLDRPGRIRYMMEFGNLSRRQVELFADKFLTPECELFKEDVVNYIMSRTVITIDITMETIDETNFLTESPKVWGLDFNAAQSNEPMCLSAYSPDTGEFLRDISTRYIASSDDFDERMVRSLEVDSIKARLDTSGPFELLDQYENVMGQVVGVTDIGDVLLCPTTHNNDAFFADFPGFFTDNFNDFFSGRCYAGESKESEIEFFGVDVNELKELSAKKYQGGNAGTEAYKKVRAIWRGIEKKWDHCLDNDLTLDGKPPKPVIVRIRQPMKKDLGLFHRTFSTRP